MDLALNNIQTYANKHNHPTKPNPNKTKLKVDMPLNTNQGTN